MKLVCESIEDILKPKTPERIKIREDKMRQKDPIFYDFINYLISLDNSFLALVKLKRYLDVHPYIHNELGEISGHNKYRDFIDKFKEHFWPKD